MRLIEKSSFLPSRRKTREFSFWKRILLLGRIKDKFSERTFDGKIRALEYIKPHRMLVVGYGNDKLAAFNDKGELLGQNHRKNSDVVLQLGAGLSSDCKHSLRGNKGRSLYSHRAGDKSRGYTILTGKFYAPSTFTLRYRTSWNFWILTSTENRKYWLQEKLIPHTAFSIPIPWTVFRKTPYARDFGSIPSNPIAL